MGESRSLLSLSCLVQRAATGSQTRGELRKSYTTTKSCVVGRLQSVASDRREFGVAKGWSSMSVSVRVGCEGGRAEAVDSEGRKLRR